MSNQIKPLLGIPTCIHLEDRQIERLNNWIKTMSTKALSACFEEDCCCASPLTFEMYSTGLGDTIKVKCLKEELDLTIGDDGEFLD